jgi:CRP-like cAMP-binding protein
MQLAVLAVKDEARDHFYKAEEKNGLEDAKAAYPDSDSGEHSPHVECKTGVLSEVVDMMHCKCRETPCLHDDVCKMCNLPLRHNIHEHHHSHYHEFRGKDRERTDHIPAADILAMYRKKTTPRTGFMVLNPNNPFFPKWDVYMLSLLTFTASFTPYEVAFLDQSTLILILVNRFVDIMFVTDMFFNFFKAYYDTEYNKWVWENWPIIKHYLRGWFVLDFISTFPLELAVVGPSPDTDSNASSLRLLRLLRLFRLLKLLRVVRASRIIQRWETVIDLRYSLLSLAGFILGILLLAHWGACLWGMIPQLEASEDNWMVAYGVDEATSSSKYLAALYWSFMTVTTIGYGDVQPKTDVERIIALIFMMLGASFYAYIVGSVCSVLNSLDQATNDFHMTMDHLNAYMQDVDTPYLLRVKLREFFVHCQGQYTTTLYENVLDRMSPGLKGEFVREAHKKWVTGLTLFSKIPLFEKERFLTLLVLHFKLESYPPREEIVKIGEKPERFYVIFKGLVAKKGRVMHAGHAFGEDFVLRDTAFSRRFYTVRSLDYSDLYTLTQHDLHTILDSGEFPAAKRALRVQAAKLLMVRWALAEAAKRIQKRRSMEAIAAGERLQPLTREGSSAAGYQILRMALDEEKENHLEAGQNLGFRMGARKLLASNVDGRLVPTDSTSSKNLSTVAEVDETDMELIVHHGLEDGEEEKVEEEEEEGVPDSVSLTDMYKMTLRMQKQNMNQFLMLQRQMHSLTSATRGRASGLSSMKVHRRR